MIFHNDHDHWHVCGPVAEWNVGRRDGYWADVCTDSVHLLGSWTGWNMGTATSVGGGGPVLVTCVGEFSGP